MGIQGLLPLVKSIMVPIHIKDFDGSVIAVDTYSWLHKGALSCSKDLCQNVPTSRHIDYCMHRVNLLRHYGVKPVLVFDGGLLPMKNEQENKRARGRKENLARAMEHDSNGNAAAAYECYQKAVDITPSIAHDLIQVLKKENISYVVAPYEADAQMTFLAVNNLVDAVITEDSDLIPFGCPRIIFKMDKYGQAVQFQYSMLQHNKDLSFSGFTKQMVLEMCILSGCDYLQSLPGMGLKRAHALIKRFTKYDKVIKHLKYSTASVPPHYEESFKRAILTFQHQRVYDPVAQDIVHLSEISSNAEEDLDFLGPMIPQSIAKGIAEGDLDPFTNMPFDNTPVKDNTRSNRTLKPKNVDHGSVKKKLDLPVQKNLLTKYFCFASLEAKRKFRAPRSSPNQSSPSDDSPLSLTDNAVEENVPSNMCSAETWSPNHHENGGNFSLPGEPVKDGLATGVPELFESPRHEIVRETRSPEHAFLQQPKHSIHRPCLMQKKENEFENPLDPVEGKIRKENKKVVVRSCYFQHKIANTNDDENEQNILTKDDLATDTHDDLVPENSADLIDGRIRKETRKVVVRSSYFQHKPVNKGNQENIQNIHDLATEMCEDSVPESPLGNGYSNVNILKRKKTTNDSAQPENAKSKQTCTETREGKFGSDVSHLARYSDIAEKSMEKFVSIISSFRFSSSGTRASGLRAPLKDIRNTSTNRSNAGADFSRFAYAPKNRKT